MDLRLKLVAIASILVAGLMGVSLSFLSRRILASSPQKEVFFIIKAFATGVIVVIALVHILLDVFENLTLPCLNENFPFSSFIAMLSAIGTLMVDSFATRYFNRTHVNKALLMMEGEEHMGHVHMHTHEVNEHAHGSALSSDGENAFINRSDLTFHRVMSQVLDLGIVAHSVIIGISLGAFESLVDIQSLVVALSFQQFLDGMGLGGRIVQVKILNQVIILLVNGEMIKSIGYIITYSIVLAIFLILGY